MANTQRVSVVRPTLKVPRGITEKRGSKTRNGKLFFAGIPFALQACKAREDPKKIIEINKTPNNELSQDLNNKDSSISWPLIIAIGAALVFYGTTNCLLLFVESLTNVRDRKNFTRRRVLYVLTFGIFEYGIELIAYLFHSMLWKE